MLYGCQGDGFSSMGVQTGTIKLAMEGTYVGLVELVSLGYGFFVYYVVRMC